MKYFLYLIAFIFLFTACKKEKKSAEIITQSQGSPPDNIVYKDLQPDIEIYNSDPNKDTTIYSTSFGPDSDPANGFILKLTTYTSVPLSSVGVDHHTWVWIIPNDLGTKIFGSPASKQLDSAQIIDAALYSSTSTSQIYGSLLHNDEFGGLFPVVGVNGNKFIPVKFKGDYFGWIKVEGGAGNKIIIKEMAINKTQNNLIYSGQRN